MWISDKWEDYKIIDASAGEKLELWGKYSLIRPDPQVIWKSDKRHRLWRDADASYKRSSKGGGNWSENKLPESWVISYCDLRFLIKPMGFKHTGLFPEQAANWDFCRRLIEGANRPIKVLNLFAYTGGATVACAKSGASVCHVDASRGMVNQAKENARLSGLSEAPIRYIVDDCKKFIEREIRRGNKYDAVIMDPPSYGRGPTGEIWKIEECIDDFVSLTLGVLSDNPLFFILNSYTTGLSASTMKYITDLRLLKRYKGHSEADELGLRISESGLPLPCGSTVRVTFG